MITAVETRDKEERFEVVHAFLELSCNRQDIHKGQP